MCPTAWKEEHVREYASLVAAVLAICFLKDSGSPLFRNSLRARNCSSSWEFSEASRLLSSKMEMTADALRAFFSGPPEDPLEPATQMIYGQKRHLRCTYGGRRVSLPAVEDFPRTSFRLRRDFWVFVFCGVIWSSRQITETCRKKSGFQPMFSHNNGCSSSFDQNYRQITAHK